MAKVKKISVKKYKAAQRKSLVELNDSLIKQYVYRRDHFKCISCGKYCKGDESPGHLISRSFFSVRWDLQNVWCQCQGCNLYHEYHPERMTIAVIGKIGLEQYTKLCERSTKTHKHTISDLINISNNLERLLKEQIKWQ
jgi:hypothetical protein